MNLPHSHVNNTVPVLIDILRDVPYIDFDHCLSWEGMSLTVRISTHHSEPVLSLEWAMPDQLVSTTVTALLKIANAHPEYRAGAFKAIVALVTEIVQKFKTADRERIVVKHSAHTIDLPSLSLRRSCAVRALLPWVV